MTGKARHLFDRAEHAVDRLTEPEHSRKYATSDAPATPGEIASEQRDESNDSSLIGTQGQRHGAIAGALVGGAVGAVVLLPLGFITWNGSLDAGWRFLVAAVIGALAGGTFGTVYGGGRTPELEGETTGPSNQPGVGTTMRDPHTDDRGRPVPKDSPERQTGAT